MATYSNKRRATIKENSDIIRANLKRFGVTSAELARFFGIKPPTFHQTLSSDVSLSTLQQIAKYCNCSVEELISPYDDRKTLSGYIEYNDIISRVNSMQDVYNVLRAVKCKKD